MTFFTDGLPKTPDNCTIIAVIIRDPPYNKHGNCKGDSWGPSVSALRPFIDMVIEETTTKTTTNISEESNKSKNNNSNMEMTDYISDN